MTFFKDYQSSLFLILLSVILAEALWSLIQKRQIYQGKEALTNFSIFAGYQVSKLLFTGWLVAVLTWAVPYRLFSLSDTLSTYLLAIVVVDFFYYCQHRMLHQVKFFWALHEVHHSSPWYNLTTSMRLNWMSPLVAPFFFLPAVLLGFEVKQILAFFILNLFYQFGLHTEAIGTLGPLEGILNTPSAHRVHHGSNAYCIDKNFGGMLMIWDRLLGTYQPETEPVIYGVTTGFQGHNPLKLVFGPMWDYLHQRLPLEGQYRQPITTPVDRSVES
jgi:sterol desaturase/sphingolipid hydroxylase (fatty acid hydroxylase superfamily)